MEEARNRYILLHDRVGNTVERCVGSPTNLTPVQVLRGELLEALPENEQPGDSTRIALGGIDRKLRVECRMEDVMKLTVEEADLLLAISSATLRYRLCFDEKRLDFGKRLEYGSQPLVSINGVSKKLPGVVWFKGELRDSPGTMFGVELHVSLVIVYKLCGLKYCCMIARSCLLANERGLGSAPWSLG